MSERPPQDAATRPNALSKKTLARHPSPNAGARAAASHGSRGTLSASCPRRRGQTGRPTRTPNARRWVPTRAYAAPRPHAAHAFPCLYRETHAQTRITRLEANATILLTHMGPEFAA
eukprot:668276-Pleurochrysis_carterae.AAC.2